jgi:hypothetical protein
MVKALKKLGIEGMFFNIIKAIYDKSITNIILNVENISSKIRNQARMLTFPTLIQHSTGIPVQSNKTGERNKKDSKNKETSCGIIPARP